MTHSGLSKVRTKSLTSGSAAPRRDGPCGKPQWGPWGPPGGATTQDVLAAIDDGGVCTLNTLPDAIHRGQVDLGYARPGHVKGSENVSFTQLVDRATGAFLPTDELRKHFDEAGALEHERHQLLRRRDCGHDQRLRAPYARAIERGRVRWISRRMVPRPILANGERGNRAAALGDHTGERRVVKRLQPGSLGAGSCGVLPAISPRAHPDPELALPIGVLIRLAPACLRSRS